MAKKKNLEKSSSLIEFFRDRKLHLIVFAFSFLLYANTIPNKYNLDDELVTSINPQKPHRLTSQGIAAIPKIFSEPYYSDQMGYAYDYRPMVLTTFAIEHTLFGDNPHVSHFINVLLYSLLCVILYITLNHVLREYNPLIVFLTTLLFSAYPMHTEVVASIKNRDEILSLAGGIGSLYFLCDYTQRKKIILLIVACTCFAFGMLSKTTAMSFVVIIPTLLILFSSISFGRLLMIMIILCALTFPFIQKGYLDERLILLFGTTLLAAVIYQLKSPLILRVILWWTTRVCKLLKKTGAFLKRIAAELKPVETSGSYYIGNLAAWTLLVMLAVSVIGFYLLSIIHSSTPAFLFLVPLLGFFPLAVFAPDKLRISITWVCLAIALYVIHRTFHKLDFIIFSFFCLFFIFKLATEKKWKIHHLVMLLLIWFPGPPGDVPYGFHETLLIVLSVASIGIAFSSFLKWLKWLALIVLIMQVVVGLSLDISNFLSSIGILSSIVIALIFLQPQRKGLIVSLITFVLLFLLLKDTSPLQANRRSDIHIQAPSYKRVQVSSGEYSYRPLDYVENVITTETPFSERLGTGMVIIGKYMRLTAIPYPLSFYYGYKVIDKGDMSDLLPLGIALLSVLLLALSFYTFNKEPVLSAALLVYLLSIFPVANIFLSIPGMMADRFLFLPSLGFCLLLSYLLVRFFKVPADFRGSLKTLPAVFKILSVIILLFYIVITVMRNAQWYDALTLMRHDIKHLDGSAQAHNLLASNLVLTALEKTDDQAATQLINEAESHYVKAISIYPEFFNATYDLARVRLMLGKLNEAEEAFLRTIDLDRTFPPPFLQTAMLMEKRGEYGSAISYYSDYLRMRPDDFEALMRLGLCYVQMRNLQKALMVMKDASQLHSQRVEPLINLSWIFTDMGIADSAKFYLHRAELMAPGHPDVINLKNALDHQGQGK